MEFTGTYDGNGYAIMNLRVDQIGDPNSSYVGLFGQIGETGKVMNLGIRNIDINLHRDGFNFTYYKGGLAGCNRGTIDCCYTTGSIETYGICIGGLIGKNYGEITRSYSGCFMTGGIQEGEYRDVTLLLGGLVGDNYGDISNCYSCGSAMGEAHRDL